METDIFPLDRMLPLSTVYRIFKGEYNKQEKKDIFFTDRKYQRLREGYFALFVGVALNKWENKEHFLRFPKPNSSDTTKVNDVNILSVKKMDEKRPKFNEWICDIKEFTQYSKSFEDFIHKTVVPKITTYSLIVGVHASIDMRPLRNVVRNHEATAWIVSNPTEKDDDYNIGLVTMFWDRNRVEQLRINLKEDLQIDNNQPITVFQDLLRDKMT